jgi:hypothetical protein
VSVSFDEQATAEGSAVTFGELREWLAEHDVDMDRCREVMIGQRLSRGGVMLRVEQYAHNEQGEKFLDGQEVAVETLWIPLKSLPGAKPDWTAAIRNLTDA